MTRLGLHRIYRRITRARRQEILARRQRDHSRDVLPLGEFSSRAWRGRLGDAYPGGGALTPHPKETDR
jgi:hypothetical protein